MNELKSTQRVSNDVFKTVYDSSASLPGRHKWLTVDGDVRKVEKVLGMEPNTIGAPLCVSGDRKTCPKCDRETKWLDIVASALDQVHSREMIARVILGDQKFVNTEARRHRRAQMLQVQDADRQHSQLQMPQLGVCQASVAQGAVAHSKPGLKDRGRSNNWGQTMTFLQR
jgi:hypothetical protein